MTQPLGELLHSRKFLILVLDTLVSIILYFGSKYVGESYFADIKFLIGALQAPALMLIYAIARENTAQISSREHTLADAVVRHRPRAAALPGQMGESPHGS
jgi:hypothetical protein